MVFFTEHPVQSKPTHLNSKSKANWDATSKLHDLSAFFPPKKSLVLETLLFFMALRKRPCSQQHNVLIMLLAMYNLCFGTVVWYVTTYQDRNIKKFILLKLLLFLDFLMCISGRSVLAQHFKITLVRFDKFVFTFPQLSFQSGTTERNTTSVTVSSDVTCTVSTVSVLTELQCHDYHIVMYSKTVLPIFSVTKINNSDFSGAFNHFCCRSI